MEFTAIHLGIIAVITIALIGLAGMLFFGVEFSIPDAEDTIEQMVLFSKSQPGLYYAQTVNLPARTTISMKAFENKNTVVTAECTSQAYCCLQGETCVEGIQWSRGLLYTENEFTGTIAARCLNVKGQFVCTLYVGKEPAQLAIKHLADALFFDYENEEVLLLGFTVTNTGKQAVLNDVTVTIQIEALEGEKETVYTKAIIIPNLYPNELEAQEVLIDKSVLTRNGLHALTVYAEALNAGTDEKKIELTVKNAAQGSCRTGEEGEHTRIEGACMQELTCADCTLASQCARAWKNQGREVEVGTKNYAFTEVLDEECSANS